MDVEVQERMGRYAVVVDGRPVWTPMGHRVESVSRELMVEVARDIERLGLDPEAGLSMYSLHAAYLDMARSRFRGHVESELKGALDTDVFVHRPAMPTALDSLWTGPTPTPADYEAGLARLDLRPLVSVMTSGARFRTPTLAWMVLAAQRPLLPLALGNCGRLLTRLSEEEDVSLPREGRFWPGAVDEAFCESRCLANEARAEEQESDFRAYCPAFQALDALRRFASYPEEPEDSMAV